MNESLEAELNALIADFDGILPPDQLQDMKALNAAGEPGIACENLCAQLHEFDIEISENQFSQIRKVGLAMGINKKYWERLSPER